MTRLSSYAEDERRHLLELPCPTFDSTPFVAAPALDTLRIAIISTAGLHRREDPPFGLGASDYRLIPSNTPANDLIMSHVSTNFDRTGFQMDVNMVFPLDRLNTLVEQGYIGSVATYHYSFMGATEPEKMEATARNLAGIMKKDGVSGVLLVPV
ncbi:MAG: glycine/sarcosine/betaine reductase selenoprotein B family protein [Desulfopila sp.]|jgi:D-proline reductase (dithiol) PrdB|nr:glycine/sarcosine/betaine reductase selenoprotein B family protein [Desulfopila sp.]